MDYVSYEEFKKMDIRFGTVVSVAEVEGADKLLCFMLDFGEVDENGKPAKVPELEPETELEIERFAAAKRRKELSLILSGKMKPTDSIELKKLFLGE